MNSVAIKKLGVTFQKVKSVTTIQSLPYFYFNWLKSLKNLQKTWIDIPKVCCWALVVSGRKNHKGFHLSFFKFFNSNSSQRVYTQKQGEEEEEYTNQKMTGCTRRKEDFNELDDDFGDLGSDDDDFASDSGPDKAGSGKALVPNVAHVSFKD